MRDRYGSGLWIKMLADVMQRVEFGRLAPFMGDDAKSTAPARLQSTARSKPRP
jgi:hypothetical protein